LYTAFNTIQNNFTELFETAGQVQTLLPGNGIAISNSDSSTFVITNIGVTNLIAGENVTITTLGGAPSSNGTLVINSTGTGNGGGSVNSVGVTSNTLSVTNSPIISSGNINVNLPTISPSVSGSYSSANIVVDQFGRIISASSGSGSGTVTSIAVTGGTGLSVSGSPITTSGTIAITNTGVTSIVAGSGVSINQSNGAVTISATGGGGNGGGTVTRVGVLSNNLTITGSPIITSGNITVDLPSNVTVNQITANIGNINSINVTTPNSNTGIKISTSSNDANLFGIEMKKSRGTNASPLQIQTNDTLLNLQSLGYTSYNQYQEGGGINIIANGSASNGSSYIPSIVKIYSTNNTGLEYDLILDNTALLTVPGQINQIAYSNVSTQYSARTSRARGTDSGNINIVQINDDIYKQTYYGYTGNGLTTIDSISGWSFGGRTEMQIIGLPQSSGAYLPTEYLITTISTANALNTFTFGSTGNLLIPNTVIANTVISNTIQSNGITISTSSNDANLFGIEMKKSRGTSTSPLQIQTNDTLLNIQSLGYTSYNQYQEGGGINIIANGSASGGSSYIPSIVKIYSTNNAGLEYDLILDDTALLTIPGQINQAAYSNIATQYSTRTSRARGTDPGNINIVQVNDDIYKQTYYGYTGNGLTTIDSISGWSFGGRTEMQVIGLPQSSGAYLPTEYLVTTISTANALNTFTFGSTGNLLIPNTVIANTIQSNGITISTSSNDANLFGIEMKKSRGTSTSPLQIQTNDVMLDIQSLGYTSYNQYQEGGGINVIANGSASSGSSYIPSIVKIYSTNNAGLEYDLKLDDTGLLTVPGQINQAAYSNIANQYSTRTARARGTDSGNINIVQINDDIYKQTYYGYTGNGLTTIDSISGWSFGGRTEMTAIGLPQSSGAYLPTEYSIITISTANALSTFTFGSTGNLLIPNIVIANTIQSNGNVNGSNANLGNLVTANYYSGTITTNAQPNITSVGTLSSLDVTGNISAGNVNISGNIVSNTVGTPTFVSTTSITLQGTTVVNVTGGAVFRLPKLSTVQKNTLAAVNGDILYDTDLNKFQGYENGAWANLI
jgi:hypothetical protein